MIPYEDFLRAKVKLAESWGYDVAESEITPRLKPHQRAMVKWAVAGGRRGIFAAFGLGKSVVQLETVRLTLTRCGGRGLIVCPLGVRQEFIRDARPVRRRAAADCHHTRSVRPDPSARRRRAIPHAPLA